MTSTLCNLVYPNTKDSSVCGEGGVRACVCASYVAFGVYQTLNHLKFHFLFLKMVFNYINVLVCFCLRIFQSQHLCHAVLKWLYD